MCRKMPYEIDIKIAERLTELRNEKGYTRRDLQRKTGVDVKKIKRFEEKGKISLSALTKIALVLDVSKDLEDLFLVPYGELGALINKFNKQQNPPQQAAQQSRQQPQQQQPQQTPQPQEN